jgi:hypothetical protein
MVLLRLGYAEYHHQPIAHAAHDGAAEAIDRIAHAGQRRRKAIERLFGVVVPDHLGRADDVGEQHRDDLAFTERLRLLDALAAVAAESGGCEIGVLAIWADDGKTDAARPTNPVVRQRLHLTGRA